MHKKEYLRSIVAGAAAGAINGVFGAGGGMVLVPMLSHHTGFTRTEVFSSSILIILPISLVTLGISSQGNLPWHSAWPYLIGGGLGGIFAALFGKRIPLPWLHRFLGAMILYAGVKYLC